MTSNEVEELVRQKTRNKVRIHRLDERIGDSVAFLSYSVDDQNQLTIWHTEVPPSLQRQGVGGRLVEQAIALAQTQGSRLRIVCPFAKDYLVRHPEVSTRSSVANEAVIETESLFGG